MQYNLKLQNYLVFSLRAVWVKETLVRTHSTRVWIVFCWGQKYKKKLDPYIQNPCLYWKIYVWYASNFCDILEKNLKNWWKRTKNSGNTAKIGPTVTPKSCLDFFSEHIWSSNIDAELLPQSEAFDFHQTYASERYAQHFLRPWLRSNFFCSKALKKAALYLTMILSFFKFNA